MDAQPIVPLARGALAAICPLCEHVQVGGAECEVCGRLLGAAVAGPAEVATLPELVPTALTAGAEAAGAPLELLETTAFAWPSAPAAERMADLEGTLAAPVEVTDDRTPDIEATRLTPVDDAVELLALGVTCRYCQAEALPGEVLCVRCGVRLPVPLAPELSSAAGQAALCSCGAPVRGSICPQCGARRA
jgi:hypothetical protein